MTWITDMRRQDARITNGELFTLASIASGIDRESIAQAVIVIIKVDDPGICAVTSENHPDTRQILEDALDLYEDDTE